MSNATPHPGMGAIPHDAGVAFRVWAPHAEAVSVIGTFNDWTKDAAADDAERTSGTGTPTCPARRSATSTAS